MEVTLGSGSLSAATVSALVVVAHAEEEPRDGFADVDRACGGLLGRLLARGDLSTQVGKATLLHGVQGVAAESVLVAGGGRRGELDAAAAHRIGGSASKHLAGISRHDVAFDLQSMNAAQACAAIAGIVNGPVGQDLYRAEKSLHPFERAVCFGTDAEAIARGVAFGEGMLLARELVNQPPNLLYPESFAQRSSDLARTHGLEVEIWDEARLEQERCGALLAVASGSARPPRLLILRYAGSRRQAPLALVGKGVTFDSGGLSLKPSESMLSMKCDMAGAATVLAAMVTMAKLRVELPVVGVIGLVENMVSGSSYKLGDVLTARSGKTIEVLNTDAEGRLVLADALQVATELKPSRIVDLATLTGACMIALGTDIAGLMSNDAEWEGRVRAAADEMGEWVWPLPMHACFAEQIRSKVADIKNVGEGRWGGAITAAKFLQEFVGDVPWAHLDIAGPAFNDSAKPHVDAGGSGALVRSLVRLAEREARGGSGIGSVHSET